MIIRVSRGFDPLYYGFHLSGLVGVAGAGAIEWGPPEGAFDGLGAREVLGLEVREGTLRRRIAVCSDDRAELPAAVAGWADVVGKVNCDPAGYGSASDRVVPIGPSFGIRWFVPSNARLWWGSGVARSHPRALWQQLRTRLPLDRYRPVESDPDRFFTLSWPWTRHPEVNPARERMIRAARSIPGLEVRGGFAPRRGGGHPVAADLVAPRRLPLEAYLRELGPSVVACNTPAVHGCLGWKLGEFLALGKAIVTLKLDRVLPAPLEHGRDIWVVDDDEESIAQAIVRLRSDHQLRGELERGARSWWDRHACPEAVARSLLGAALPGADAPAGTHRL